MESSQTSSEWPENQAAGASKCSTSPDCWKVLLVDDDVAVHQVTRMVMSEFLFDGRPLAFLSAYSGAEACDTMRNNPDIALVLLDVVMEHDQAGLDVIHYIRRKLKNNRARIVLRTGRPENAPEDDIVRRYDIHDYKDKTELTKAKLVTLFFSALRSYRDILAQWAQPHKTTGKAAPLVETAATFPFTNEVLIPSIAHEISTLLGGCVSSLSLLRESMAQLSAKTGQQVLCPDTLKQELAATQEALDLTWDNLNRAVNLVQSGKMTNADSGASELYQVTAARPKR